jgi:hypothetical protein
MVTRISGERKVPRLVNLHPQISPATLDLYYFLVNLVSCESTHSHCLFFRQTGTVERLKSKS